MTCHIATDVDCGCCSIRMREFIVSQPMRLYRSIAAITIMCASGCARVQCEHAVVVLDLQPYTQATA